MNQSSTLTQKLAASAFVNRQDTLFTDLTNCGSFKYKWDNSKLSNSIVNKYSNIQERNSLQNSSILQESKFSNNSNDRSLRRQQVKSIIFDSKIQKIDSKTFAETLTATYLSQNKINAFKNKVVKLNVDIQAGINNVQNMIQQLRKKKKECALQQKAKINNKIQQLKNVCQQTQEQESSTNSMVGVKNQSKIQFAFPPQYTTLINELSSQIQIDMQFTNMVSELTRKGLISTIKDIICNQLSSKNDTLIQSFLKMEPSEIDPLEPKPDAPAKHTQQWLRQKAQQLHNKYTETSMHFQNKLKHKYSPQIIKFLYEQLSKTNSSQNNNDNKESITIGQFISYINIKTNTCFRNRFFVKIMKRLNLKGNGNVNIDSLQQFVCAGVL